MFQKIVKKISLIILKLTKKFEKIKQKLDKNKFPQNMNYIKVSALNIVLGILVTVSAMPWR